MLIAIPKLTKGKLTLTARDRAEKPLTVRADTLPPVEKETPELLPLAGTSVDSQTREARFIRLS